MAVDLRCTKRRKRSSDAKTVECWLCGGNHFYRDKYTGRVCTREPTYDEERLKRFQGEDKQQMRVEAKLAAAPRGIEQSSFAQVVAGNWVNAQVRATEEKCERVRAELQDAQREAKEANARAALAELAVKECNERSSAAAKVADDAKASAATAEKQAEQAEKRAAAAEKAAAEAEQRAAAVEKAAKEANERALAMEKRLAEMAQKMAAAGRRVEQLEETIGDKQHGFMGSLQIVTASFAQREADFIKSTTAELEAWKREWQRKFDVMHKVFASKQGKAVDEAAASNTSVHRPLQSSVSVSASAPQPSASSRRSLLSPRKRPRSTSPVAAVDGQDKDKAQQPKTTAASINS